MKRKNQRETMFNLKKRAAFLNERLSALKPENSNIKSLFYEAIKFKMNLKVYFKLIQRHMPII